MLVREPVFAFQGWYPAKERSCRRAIAEHLASYRGQAHGNFAGIVPHAGWSYSGRVAGWTFAALRALEPEVVFLFGGHMRRRDPVVCMASGAWGTPLGPVPVEEDLATELVARFDAQVETPRRFTPENTIELQLPFLRAVWPEARVVAAQVPPGPTSLAVGRWAAEVTRDRAAVAIGSTDLTHYGRSYGYSPRGTGVEAHRWSKEDNDRAFLDHLAGLQLDQAMDHATAHHSACCPGAAAAAGAFAAAHGAERGELLSHATSHEIAGYGTPSTWVGYASMVF